MSAISDRRVLPSNSPNKGLSIKVLLVADNLIISAGLQMLLKSDPALCVDEATRTSSVLSASNYHPDVIVLVVERYADLALISELRRALSDAARILTLICPDDTFLKLNAMKHGATGVVIDVDDPRMLFAAVKALYSHKTFVSPTLSHTLFSRFYDRGEQTLGRLTPREYDIIECVCQGLLNKQIAVKLNISEATVKHHIRTIFSKVNISNRAELVAYAYKTGIVRSH
jgi:DNA-binding NarL/FixJ family response regulator